MCLGENIRQPAGIEENTGGVMYIYIESGHYVVLAGGLRCHRVATSTISAIELFFGDFSAARPRFVARLARIDSPHSRGPCPRAYPPSPRPSRSASEVARSRLRGLPHASQAQPCFFATTCLLGSSYSPTVTLFLFWSLSGSRPS